VIGVADEMEGSRYGVSPSRHRAERAFPITRPQPVRGGWWLGVGAAAFGFLVRLHCIGTRQRHSVVVVSALHHVVFAGGDALGANRTT
jgi:hypothetical protein